MNESIIVEYCQIIKNKISQARFQSAMRNIDKLLYNFPANPFGYYYRGVCEFALERYDKSVNSYLTAIKLNPAFDKAYFNLGISYYCLNKYDNALINIGKALVLFSKKRELDNKKRCIEALKIIESERR